MMNCKLKFIDLFAGCGGLSLGLMNAGLEGIFAIEKTEDAFKTLIHNLDHKKIKNGYKWPIWLPQKNMTTRDLLDNYQSQLQELKDKVDLIAGGPPCQGFSVQRRGADEDPRNQLVFKYAQLVDELYPRYFVMENVSGIAGKRGKTILEELLDKLKNIGYTVHIKLLDAQNYGVAQRRKRYIIIGERSDMGANYEYPKEMEKHYTVRDVIGSLPEPPEDGSDYPGISLHRRDRLSEINLKRIRALKPGQGREYLPKELLADCHKIDSSVIGYRNVYGRMAWDEVSPTITARFDSFTRGKFGHPEQDRSISLREGAMLQTFPKDFLLLEVKLIWQGK